MNKEPQNCPKCGKECKDKRGITIHLKKCNTSGINNKMCSYCETLFSSVQSKERHLGVCLPYQLSKKEEEYERKMEALKEEYNKSIQAINQNVDSRTHSIHSELIDKIMSLDKETNQTIQSKIAEEKSKWMEIHNSEIAKRDDRIEKLDEENHFLRNVVSKIGLLSNADKTIEEDSVIYTGNKSMEYVYIIQEREFVKEERPLYKIGRTTQKPYQRYSGYPKGSIEFMCMSVYNSKIAEGLIKKVFSAKFKQDRNIGIEYFEGDVEEMKKEFILLIDTINKKNTKVVL